LAVRAVGENPAAVEAQGLSVTGLRMGAVIVGSGLMAVGGAFLTLVGVLSASSSKWSTAAAGSASRWSCSARGGRARPCWARSCLPRSTPSDPPATDALGRALPYQLFLMLPYILSILALDPDVAPRRGAARR
jgi:ABC-type uncharacterized transport system permease subunit